jgi:hypothetical protein
MSYNVKVDYPTMPKGQEVLINGLGTFQNGATVAVSDEDADSFRAYQKSVGMPDVALPEAFKDDEYVSVTSARGTPRHTVSDQEPAGAETVSDESKVEEGE